MTKLKNGVVGLLAKLSTKQGCMPCAVCASYVLGVFTGTSVL